MSLLEEVKNSKLPQHIAIIMDGNGRWARQRGEPRVFGHRYGVKAVREVIEAAAEAGIKYLSLYAFSTENWGRPDEEVTALMSLMIQSLNDETENLLKNNIRLKVIGDTERLKSDVRDRLDDTIERTADCTGLTVIVAISYSARWEIAHAAKKIGEEIEAGKINSSTVNEELFAEYLTTRNIPDPELMIRTSGEQRISNFLLWQLAYTELYFSEILWPDFGKEDLYRAILSYQNRERRFGKTSDQILDKP